MVWNEIFGLMTNYGIWMCIKLDMDGLMNEIWMVLNVIWESNLNEWLKAIWTCLDLNKMGINTSLGLDSF